MIHLGPLLHHIIQAVRSLVASAAPALVAPARPVYRGAREGWVYPPHTLLPRFPGPVWSLLSFRLDRLAVRLQRLYDRWLANTLPSPRPRRPRPATPRPKAAPARIPELPIPGVGLADAPARLPRGHGWVLRRIPEVGSESGRLHEALQNPHSRAFVEAAPQAARLLRPLCRALGVDLPDWLRLPPRPRRTRKPRPRAEKPRRWKLTDPELKLRPYEIAAARYFIKKYGRDG